MLYKVICAATIAISSISVLTQLILLPWLHQHTGNLKAEFESRLRKFHHNARQFDEQLHRLGKLAGTGVTPLLSAAIDENVAKMKRQIPDCPPPRVGSPGSVGDAGEDGEPGEAGEDGAAGLDAMTLLMQEAQKCVICPQGPAGPIGAPGQQGLNGQPGEKGEIGEAGIDGLDGEQGPEGLPGLPGIAGKAGKKGPPGSSAPGGTGPPGPPGVKGPLGPTGKQGERGRRNFVIGMPGSDGRSGKQGLDGLEGKPGGRGEKGPMGEDGADARFCPCPSELNKLGSGEKPHSHLMPPSGLPTPSINPTKAAPPAPAQAPSFKSPEEERKSSQSTSIQSEQEGAQIGGGSVVPIKQPISGVINNGSAETATNLRIAHLRPGEQPTTGKEAATQINNYEDAYPNYESSGNEDGAKGAGKGKGKSGEEAAKPLYDDEIQLNGAERGGGQQQEEVKPAAIAENGVEGNAEVGEDEEDNPQQEGGAALMATRKFVYVTKKPRPKL